MRRNTLIVALISLFTFTLVVTACGDNGDAAKQSPQSSTPDPAMDTMEHQHDESSPVVDGARRIEVTATSLSYDPKEITVTAGEDIAIVLSSDDLLHDFTVEDTAVHVAADRGKTAEGGLRIDKPGSYTYYCTVPGHRDAGMEGTLVVKAT